MSAAELYGLEGVTHAITLWPEWAYAIRHLGKDVENRGDTSKRSYVALRGYVGERIAIHAGAYIGGRPDGHGPLKWRSSDGMRAMLYTASRAAGRTIHVPSPLVVRRYECSFYHHPCVRRMPGPQHVDAIAARVLELLESLCR